MDSGALEWAQRQWYESRGVWDLSVSGTRIISVVGVLGVVGFVMSAVVLSMILADRDDVDLLEKFADNVLANYLTHKCSRCIPGTALAYNLNITDVLPDPVRMYLRGQARQDDQFITGLTTPCAQCTPGGLGGAWNSMVSQLSFEGNYGLRTTLYGFLRGHPYAISQYGVTYDPLGLWSKSLGLSVSTRPAKDRCDSSRASSMYVVAVSADVVQEVCCKYVVCFCTIPGPREFCTRPLLLADDPSDADRFNCLYGNTTGGCGCGSDVC